MKGTVAVAILIAGCTTVRSLPIGVPVEPKALGCAVRQEQVSPTEADAIYRQVGVICIADGRRGNHVVLTDISARARADFDREVCALGGEVVVVSGLCSDAQYRMNGTEYRVYRAR